MSCVVSVCRGCCCGTPRKHPGVDHDAQLNMLRELTGRAGRIRITTCLGYCAASNVITVSPSPVGRRQGGRPTWFGFILDERVLTELATWIRAGGPGCAPVPDALALHIVRPPGRISA